MPLLPNAKKDLRASARKAVVNNKIRSRIKTMTDKAKKEQTAETISAAFSSIDKAVKSNVVHKNKAARLKSQLSKRTSTKK